MAIMTKNIKITSGNFGLETFFGFKQRSNKFKKRRKYSHENLQACSRYVSTVVTLHIHSKNKEEFLRQ